MNIRWYVNRLRAMSLPEVRWRAEQKLLSKMERRTFGKRRIGVDERVFYTEKADLTFHGERMPLYLSEDYAAARTIPLPGGFDYEIYRKDWHAGFQTDRHWKPEFSYDLHYKQRDEIGDARTNWELNRHYQFALLACGYARTGDGEYFSELCELFEDWNRENPFLYGISWTSVMETAIRTVNWIHTLGFLLTAQAHGRCGNAERVSWLCERLRIGIINMTEYISRHYSRYSSANNHVIVEAAAMGMAGIMMNCAEWYDTAFYILQYEIERQNYSDGVNRELSLHYQSFFMEAVGLLVLTMQKNGMRIPQMWRNTLVRMSRYVSDCRGKHGETIVFGDDDEGKILDLQGVRETGKGEGRGREQTGSGQSDRDHYAYVLQMMSLILPERYTESITDQTLWCVAPPEQIRRTVEKPYYKRETSVCYREGGVSILRAGDGRALIGIDHGALGFGSIAAHGHADALSFQMFLNGRPVFADAGTYIYHIKEEDRNLFRRTESHNTVTINKRDQSEMLGAFLWGKKAGTRLTSCNLLTGNGGEEWQERIGNAGQEGGEKPEWLRVEAEHDGYAPVIHRRGFAFDGERCLKICDSLLHVEKETDFQIGFLLGPDCRITEEAVEKKEARIDRYSFLIEPCKGETLTCKVKGSDLRAEIADADISLRYGRKEKTKRLCISGRVTKDAKILTMIRWEKKA